MISQDTKLFTGKNLLIIEDEAIIALHLKNLARQLGLDVVGLSFSCREALEVLKSTTVDIVFLDIYLKDRDQTGIDLAKILNREFNIHQIIYITANADAATRKAAESTKHMGYLQKPVEIQHIREILYSPSVQ